ncbi:MAG: aliphatic sulfonate ABC transporter substrate-binding protein [Rhizobacter sp.]
MSTVKNLPRRSVLGILAVTAASWWPAARGNTPTSTTPLRIGFQKGSINLTIMKSQRYVEQRLPNTPVQWIEFPAGPQLLEALAVGSVDFGSVGDSPPVFAQAAGKDIFYVGAEPTKPDTSALLVREGSPLKTLADLKGKRIALQKGSSSHFLLVQIVKRAGLQWSDIQPIYLAPADARAAFERGSVDGWVIWDPYYAAAELDGKVRPLITSRGLTSNNSFYLASRSLAQQEPVLRHLFSALTETDAHVYKNRGETAKQYAEFSGLGLATVLRFLERRPRSPVGPLTPALIAEQQKVADTFHELGLIPKAIRVADIVWQPGQQVAQATR